MAQEKVAPTIEEPVDQKLVDDAIASMEKLYETLTGGRPSHGDPAGARMIPVERDPGEFVAERLERLVHALGQPLAPFAASEREWAPPIVVWESSLDTVVAVDLPGVQRTGVEVVADNGVVTVSGERPATPANLSGHRLS